MKRFPDRKLFNANTILDDGKPPCSNTTTGATSAHIIIFNHAHQGDPDPALRFNYIISKGESVQAILYRKLLHYISCVGSECEKFLW